MRLVNYCAFLLDIDPPYRYKTALHNFPAGVHGNLTSKQNTGNVNS